MFSSCRFIIDRRRVLSCRINIQPDDTLSLLRSLPSFFLPLLFFRTSPATSQNRTIRPTSRPGTMKFISLVVSFICLATSSIAASDKLQKFQSLSHTRSIALNESLYDELTSKPRDYYVAIVFTATDARFGCILCREFQPEWELIVQTWNKGRKPEGLDLVFGTLDFLNGRSIFQRLMLQTAPVILLFPPSTGPYAKLDSSPLRFDFSG